MLIELTVENYRSIAERQTLSMVRNAGKEHDTTNICSAGAPGTPEVVRSAVIYGPNAAGKSNIIKSMMAIEEIVLSSAGWQRGYKIPITPYRLDKKWETKPSFFEVVFVSEGTRYQYGFTLTRDRIWSEWLYAYPKGKAQVWIDREYDDESGLYLWGNNEKLTGNKKIWQESTRDNALFLSTAVQLNSDMLKPVFDWFAVKLRVHGSEEADKSSSAKACGYDDLKEKIIGFLSAADFGISDIKSESKKFLDTLNTDVRAHINPELEKFLTADVHDVEFAHERKDGSLVYFDLKDESDGTRRMFSLAIPWLIALQEGFVMFVDELHSNLHPLLCKFLVDLFHSQANIKGAQLVFTTHETSILSQDVFRRDQVWFCEREKGNTTLYPLSDFKVRQNVGSLERSYLSGRYGALPFFKKIDFEMAENNGKDTSA